MLAAALVCASCVSPPPDPPSPLAFEDVTATAGIRVKKDTWGTFGAAWADFDNDGHLDLFVGRHSAVPALFRSTGRGTFVEVTKAAGLLVGFLPENLNLLDRHGCAWGDANGDGRADLYCSTGAEGGKGSDPNQLFVNQGNGTFAESAQQLGVDDGPGRGRGVNWIDYDRDGQLDLYVANTK
ncbi:MAG: FG-GAP repeat domain-containing protein, partial [Candidatus Binatia bacterium]